MVKKHSQCGDAGQALGQEDPLQEDMATRPSALAPGNLVDRGEDLRLQPMGSQRVGHNRVTKEQQASSMSGMYILNVCSQLNVLSLGWASRDLALS